MNLCDILDHNFDKGKWNGAKKVFFLKNRVSVNYTYTCLRCGIKKNSWKLQKVDKKDVLSKLKGEI